MSAVIFEMGRGEAMKTRPFCREKIRDDAIKCRYCGPSLLPPQPALENPEPAPNKDVSQVIYVGANQFAYILDKGLIRFAKFAFAVLALIITGAAIFGGLDIQHGVEKVGDGIDKVRDLEDKARDSRASVEKMVKQVQEIEERVKSSSQRTAKTEGQAGQLRDETKRLRDEVQSFVELIHKNEPLVFAFFAKISPQVQGIITAGPISPQPNRPWVTARELAKYYDMPPSLDGSGQTIGIVELAGGYSDSDLESYFHKLGIPAPRPLDVSVDGTENKPDNRPDGADSQVTSDIEIAGAVASRAKLRVYFTQDIAAGVRAATADKVSIILISWGADEANWGETSIVAADHDLKAAADAGITILCASEGDSASFPSTSSRVTAVGATSLEVSGGKIVGEVTAGDQSATLSKVLPMPPWQSEIAALNHQHDPKRRAVPDVAANADPNHGYWIILHGSETAITGTSPAAAFWAGAIALINQGVAHNVGYINPYYIKPSDRK